MALLANVFIEDLTTATDIDRTSLQIKCATACDEHNECYFASLEANPNDQIVTCRLYDVTCGETPVDYSTVYTRLRGNR